MLTGAGKLRAWSAGRSPIPCRRSCMAIGWRHMKIDGALVPLACAREDFARVIGGLQRAGFRGVNVTVPHKEAAFALAHFCDAAATGGRRRQSAGLSRRRPDRRPQYRHCRPDGIGARADGQRCRAGRLCFWARAARRAARFWRWMLGRRQNASSQSSGRQGRDAGAFAAARGHGVQSCPAASRTGARWRPAPTFSSMPPAPA